MSEHHQSLMGLSRRRLITGAAVATAMLALGKHEWGDKADAALIPQISDIKDSATANAPAVRLNPPAKPVRDFNPWEPGETIATVPNSEGKIALRIDDGPWASTTNELDKILSDNGMRGIASLSS